MLGGPRSATQRLLPHGSARSEGRILDAPSTRETLMSKGMDQKKQTKKKPAKTLEEKRAAKREKRQAKGR
jgi:hypothetical protein